MEITNSEILYKLRIKNFAIFDVLPAYQINDFLHYLERLSEGVDLESYGQVKYKEIRTIEEEKIAMKRELIYREKLRNILIQSRDYLANLNADNSKEPLLELELTEHQQKIIYLEKIGVLDFLRKKYSITSNSELANVLHPFIEIKADTIRKTLERIVKNEIKESTEGPVMNTINKLKLNISKEK